MQIDLTLSGPAGDLDVRVEAGGAPPLSAVRAALADDGSWPADADLYAGGRALPQEALLGSAGLRSGSRLTPEPESVPEPAAYTLQVLSGPSAGDVHPLRRGEFVIGRDPSCDIVLADPRASRHHVVLTVGAGSVSVRDLGSTNGTSVDGVPVPLAGRELPPGDVLGLGGSLVGLASTAVAPASAHDSGGRVVVNRPPRRGTGPTAGVIDRPAPPRSPRPRPVQWVAALVPATASMTFAWFTGSLVFLLFGLLSPLMLVSTAVGDRVHWRRSRRRAGRSARAALREFAVARDRALAAEADRLREDFPDPPTIALVAATPGLRLWERRLHDDDLLAVRIGAGQVAARTLVRAGDDTEPAGMLRSAPLVVDLCRGPVGVAGSGESAQGLARWVVAQLATLHAPSDLDLILLVDAAAAERWRWTRWLPHLQARVADTEAGHADLLAGLRADISRRSSSRAPGGAWGGPWTVVVVDCSTEVSGLDATLAGAATAGVSALVVGTDPGALPSRCRTVVTVAESRVTIHRGDAPDTGATEDATGTSDTGFSDTVTVEWADALARALTPLVVDDDHSRALPDAGGLLEALDVVEPDADRIARSWQADDGRPDTVLGWSADGPFGIDLATDGPHALIAGTTGAGKSSLLQTLVAGLCLRHPPTAVTVLLVDYKGGAAFGDCASLPHCVGLVTDLDPQLTERALSSLGAELRRRERLLATVGAADLETYRAVCRSDDRSGDRVTDREALPRLVIVVDEFAALADELPDFVPGLIGLANRGRSLGVHLVLATQRPGSVVSAEIRANTSLRVALRVTDPAESADVIGVRDAASILPATPGRAYVRTASGLTRIQSARAAGGRARGPDEIRVTRLDPWRRPVAGGSRRTVSLAEIVAAVRAATVRAGLTDADNPWLPVLPDRLALDALPDTAFALLDHPAEQSQQPMSLEPGGTARGSTLVLGGPGSGRTTALAVMALRAAQGRTPDDLELHVIDPTGDLLTLVGGLPHVGTTIGPDDGELIVTLLERLTSAPGGGRSAMLLVDAWETVLAARDDLEAELCRARLEALLRAATAPRVVVAGDRSLTGPRVSGAFADRLALRFADRGDYAALGIPARAVPARLSPGRGVRAGDGALFQIAVPGAPGDDVAAAIRSAARAVARRSPPRTRPATVRLRALPARVTLAEVPDPATSPHHDPPRLVLGLAGDDRATLSLDPFAGSRRWVVAGPPRSGRSTVLAVLLAGADALGLSVVLAAPPHSPLLALTSATAPGPGGPVRVVDPAGRLAPEPPGTPTLLLVDDAEAFTDTDAGDALLGWVRDTSAPVSVVLTARSDELSVTYRGLAAEVRRSRTGIVLRPGPVDGELLGLRLPRAGPDAPPGRGVLVPDRAWSPASAAAIPVQIALPNPNPNPGPLAHVPSIPPVPPGVDVRPAQPMWGYR